MMIYNNYNIVQNIYERFAAGKRVARSRVSATMKKWIKKNKINKKKGQKKRNKKEIRE